MQAIVPPTDHNPNDRTEEEILDALRGVTGTRRLSFRYELLDDANTKIGDLPNVESGTITQNWLADIKRTASFTVGETDYIDYLSDRIKPWVRLHIPPYRADDWVEWPQGVFILSTPTRGISGAGHVSRAVQGYDLLQVLADDKVTTRQVVTAGTLYTTAIWILLGAGNAYVDWSTLAVPADIEWDPGTTKLAIINDLLSAINYQSISVDENGVYQVRTYRAPPTRAAEYVYADDMEGIMFPEVDQTLDLFSVPNQWALVVSEPDRPPIVGTYTNTDPGSLTSTVRRGRTITDFRNEQDAADQATLDAKAARLGFEASQVYEAIDFETGINPLHSGNDIYRITYGPLAVDADFVEHTWSMPLEAGAAMKHRARRVVSLS
jgi:hypothetical protein